MNFKYTKKIKDRWGNEIETINTIKLLNHISLLIITLIILLNTFGTIDAGERGVQIRLGDVIGTKEPGLYVKAPIIDKIKKFNTKTQTVIYERENPLSSASKDLQDVQVAVVLNYHLDPNGVQKVYTEFGTEQVFSDNVIRPAVRDTVKAIASQFTAEELVTKRPEFTSLIQKALTERLESKYIIVERVNITNFQFSESFTQSIEAKVKAEQDALTAKNKLEQVKFEKQQRIEQAQGEAEAIRISAQAINSQGGEDYVALKAVEKWNGILPINFVPGSSIPFIQLP